MINETLPYTFKVHYHNQQDTNSKVDTDHVALVGKYRWRTQK